MRTIVLIIALAIAATGCGLETNKSVAERMTDCYERSVALAEDALDGTEALALNTERTLDDILLGRTPDFATLDNLAATYHDDRARLESIKDDCNE